MTKPTRITTEDDLKRELLVVIRRAATSLDPPQIAAAMGETMAQYLEYLTGELLEPDEAAGQD